MNMLIAALMLMITASAERDPLCLVAGPGVAEDMARARAACDIARERFARLIGESAPRVQIVLREQTGYRTSADGGTAILYWPTGATLRTHLGSGTAAERQIAQQWSDVLPHEIGHALMIAHFYPTGGASTHRGYGTPLADWFEEAVAIWAEPDASRATRLAQARRLPPHRQDLERILSGSHPAAANTAYLASRDAGTPAANAALWAFYPQSYAVLAFVHEHGGTTAVAELARRIRAGEGAGARLLVGLNGLPLSNADLLRLWQVWITR